MFKQYRVPIGYSIVLKICPQMDNWIDFLVPMVTQCPQDVGILDCFSSNDECLLVANSCWLTNSHQP